ncbi:MAG: heavy metal translocating P-type ATPase, partial [Hominilimicola sp.]
MKKNNDSNIAEDNKAVCCEKHEHHHEHEGHCGCGHDHHKHEHEAHCSCGHEHHHEHDDRCGCGHDNHHEHEDHCGCGHDHDHHEHGCGCGCGCGCEHGEEDEKVLTIRLIAGAILFAAGIVTENVLSSPLISDILFVVAYIVLGYDIVWNAIKNIFKGHLFNENFLMSIASIGAFAVGEHPEAVAVMLFYQVGEALQERAAQKSRNSITELMDIRPDYANIEVNGTITKVSPSEISIGDIIIVKPGEKIPLDGTITSGETYLDTKALTGESVPRKAVTGDTVLSGSLNTGSPIYIKVEKTYGESTVSKILDMVEHAQSKKAKSEKFISVFAKYYTPIVVALAVTVMFVPPLFLGDFRTWIYRGLMFLVVSCPCALVVSIPLGFFAGIGCASKNGILVKGSNFIEKLAKLDTVVFDKTGTLTKGVFAVKGVYSVIDKNELIKYAAYAEFYSTHPIAVSVKNAYKNTVDTAKILNYTEISGMGISADIDGHKVLAGNGRLLESNNISHEKAKSHIGSIIYIAVDGKFAGYIVISDEIKADSKAAISALKQLNIKSVMLTGDIKKNADYTAEQIGIDKVYSQLLPQDKVS